MFIYNVESIGVMRLYKLQQIVKHKHKSENKKKTYQSCQLGKLLPDITGENKHYGNMFQI